VNEEKDGKEPKKKKHKKKDKKKHKHKHKRNNPAVEALIKEAESEIN